MREDGKAGVRNHVISFSTVACANHVAEQISRSVEGVVVVPCQYGCLHIGEDLERLRRSMIGVCENPNVAAVVVVGLGCEQIHPKTIVENVKNKPIEYLTIQDEGGTSAAIKKGIGIAGSMVQYASRMRRVEVPLEKIVLGTKCGGSDSTNAIASNPSVGIAADLLIQQRGIVLLGETSGLVGSEHLLAERALTKEIGDEIFAIVDQYRQEVMHHFNKDLQTGNPSPGNIAGGITTLQEKSLGAVKKGGSTPVQGVLKVGENPKAPGLWVLDNPAFDIVSVSEMVATGAQIVLFTTGEGTPVGSPIAPIIKICGNPETYQKMSEDIDVNAGAIIKGQETIESMGRKIFDEIIEVASGKLTKAEILGHREFCYGRIGSTL
jgi:altronate dehydratase large subunit